MPQHTSTVQPRTKGGKFAYQGKPATTAPFDTNTEREASQAAIDAVLTLDIESTYPEVGEAIRAEQNAGKEMTKAHADVTRRALDQLPPDLAETVFNAVDYDRYTTGRWHIRAQEEQEAQWQEEAQQQQAVTEWEMGGTDRSQW